MMQETSLSQLNIAVCDDGFHGCEEIEETQDHRYRELRGVYRQLLYRWFRDSSRNLTLGQSPMISRYGKNLHHDFSRICF